MENLVDMCPNIEFLRLDKKNQRPLLPNYDEDDGNVLCDGDAVAVMRFSRLKSFHAYGSHLLYGFSGEKYSASSIPLDDGAFLVPVSNKLTSL